VLAGPPMLAGDPRRASGAGRLAGPASGRCPAAEQR